MECRAVKSGFLAILACKAMLLMAAGCAGNLYTKLKPEYDLVANQDKKILIFVESPRSAAADKDAPEKLAASLQEHLTQKAKIKLENIVIFKDIKNPLIAPQQAAKQAGAGIALFVRIEEYELLPINIKDYHSARLVTRSVVIDAETGRPLWPGDTMGKLYDIAIEMGKGGREAVFTQMNASMAQCILRSLYPIQKLYYRNSDERIPIQQAFETDTF